MKHLLAISIGPVQPFIEAARRTGDLSAGSQLLVEIAKAAAESISSNDPDGQLIFPAKDSQNKITDGPNKILAIVAGDPAALAEDARTAAQQALDTAWQSAVKKAGQDKVKSYLAEHQVSSFLEFYAAWATLEHTSQYAEARNRVELLLAGRKQLRDFAQPRSEPGAPKSPLDPARDGVIHDPAKYPGPPLYLKPAEHLDAVSLIKRIRGRETKAKSTTELAATVLMEQLKAKAQEATQALEDYAGPIEGVGPDDLLYRGRRDDALKAGELTAEQAVKAKELAEQALRKAGFGADPPDWASYYAILVADGDRMGALLSQMESPESHLDLSGKLSQFAKGVQETVECHHHGHCVYSGGDDVVALLPAHTALACAAQLAHAFHDAVPTSLSVGVAIVHHLDPLRVSLEHARAAERAAKKERNSLAVALHTRGGEPRIAVEPWSDKHSIKTWEDWTAAFRGKEGLSHGFPYELRHLAREARETLPAQPGQPAAVLHTETLREEALRILARKQGGADHAEQEPKYLDSLRQAISQVSGPDDLEKLVAKLVICRFLAQIPEVK